MNMNPRSLQSILLALVMMTIFLTPVGVLAAPNLEVATLSLEELGGSDIVLTGPYDTGQIRFSLPASWFLMEGAQLQIQASSFFAGPANTTSDPSTYLGAILDVYFNENLQQSISLVSGSDILYIVPIDVQSLPSVRPDGTIEISFFLNAAIDCEYDFHKTTVLISSDSKVSLPYTILPIKTDLRKLPWPIYQPNLKEQVGAVMIIPNKPTTDELQAAMLVVAGLSRMTGQKLPVSVATVDEFTLDVRNENDLIFVGKAGGLTVLAGSDLPIPIVSSRYSSAGMQADDGVIELAVSPWNNVHTILVVGGNSDAGVVKAAQAFTTQNLQTGDSPSSVIVAEVNPISSLGVFNTESVQIDTPDILFSDLGYSLETSNLLGNNWFTYEFTLPPGQVSSGQPSIDLLFSHSTLIDAERSGIAVYLNNDLVGSTGFDAENSNYVSGHINLPASGIVPGHNVIEIQASLIPRDVCSVFATTGVWITIYPESLLHLTLVPSTEAAYQLKDLSDFPYPFTNEPGLNSTTLVVSQTEPRSWKEAGKIAYYLGGNATGSVLNMEMAFSDTLAQLQTPGQNLIIIGKPSELPAISELGDVMPAKFDSASNIAILENQGVVYRFSANKNLGYLELFSAPWDVNSTILMALGTADEGIGYAINALITPQIRNVLRGNFATLDEDRPSVVDTRTGQGLGRLPVDLGPSITVQETPSTPSPIVPPSTDTRKNTLVGIVVVAALMLVVIVIALILRKRASPPRQ